MANEPVSADGAVISIDRLMRAAAYAAYAASLPHRPYLVVTVDGIRATGIDSRNFATKTAVWAELSHPGALKAAIDAVEAELASKR